MQVARQVSSESEDPLGVLMLERGLSNERAAALAGVCSHTIRNWRDGSTKPRPDALERLVDVLGDRSLLDVVEVFKPAERIVPLPMDPEKLENIIAAVLSRRGMSMGEAARRIGVHRESIRNWVKGIHRPDKANLVRLATELDAPELLEVESYDPNRAWVVAKCPDCDKEREYRLSDLERVLERQGNPGTSLRFGDSREEAIYRCHTCASRKVWRDWERSLSRLPGGKTAYWKEAGRRLARLAAIRFTPESEARAERFAAARAATVGKIMTEKERLAHRRGVLKFQPASSRLSPCRYCGYLVEGSPQIGHQDPQETHRSCLQKYRVETRRQRSPQEQRSDAGRRRKIAGDWYPPVPRHRVPAAKELALSREISLRVLRDRETITSVIEELQSRGEKVPVSSQGIYQRINRFLALFPPDDRGSKNLGRLRDLLWGLARERGFGI